MIAWSPTSSQYPFLVLLAALVLLGITIIITAFSDRRRDQEIDLRIRRRYPWTGRAERP